MMPNYIVRYTHAHAPFLIGLLLLVELTATDERCEGLQEVHVERENGRRGDEFTYRAELGEVALDDALRVRVEENFRSKRTSHHVCMKYLRNVAKHLEKYTKKSRHFDATAISRSPQRLAIVSVKPDTQNKTIFTNKQAHFSAFKAQASTGKTKCRRSLRVYTDFLDTQSTDEKHFTYSHRASACTRHI